MRKMLKDISITFISLVRKGANKKQIIYKSADFDESLPALTDIDISKFDEEKGIVYGIVYAPDEVDTQGDSASAVEIEKAAYDFMENLRNGEVDKQHSEINVEAFVAESWIVRKNDELFPKEKKGSWAVGIKLKDDELKKEVKEGKITGLSMFGTATKVEKEDKSLDISGLTEKITETIKNLMKKGDADMDEKQVQELIDKAVTGINEEIKKSQDEAPKVRTDEEMATIIKTVLDNYEPIKKLSDKVDIIEKNSSESVQTDEEIKTDLEKQDEEGLRIAKMVNDKVEVKED